MPNDKAKTEQAASGGGVNRCIISLLAFCLFALAGCSDRSAQNNNSSPQPQNVAAADSAKELPKPTKENPHIFEVRGVVTKIEPGEKQVVIKHEEIPNYMPAMTMPFDVKNTNELAGLSTNDQVTFRMIVTDDDGWIENIKKIGVADLTSQGQAVRPKTRLVRDVQPLAVGDKMPNYPLTNSLGQKIELKDFAGQAYAFTFIFTRCPFPNFCPRMNTNFQQAYEDLKNNPNAPTNWHLISISFDPEFDTPERLKAYSKTYNPDPKKWSWVTGAMIEIDAITEQLGVYFAAANGSIDHNLRTAVVDKNGVIRQIFIGNEWSAEELVGEIIAGAEGKEVGQY